MSSRKMLRQIMSTADIYAHAETLVEMLRDHYGTYDADALDEVPVDESFVQRIRAKGYDVLPEGAADDRPAPRPSMLPSQRRDMPRAESGAAPGRGLPLRRRDSAGEGETAGSGRRSTSDGESFVPFRRQSQPDGAGSAPGRPRDAGGDSSVGGARRDAGRLGQRPRPGLPSGDGSTSSRPGQSSSALAGRARSAGPSSTPIGPARSRGDAVSDGSGLPGASSPEVEASQPRQIAPIEPQAGAAPVEQLPLVDAPAAQPEASELVAETATPPPQAEAPVAEAPAAVETPVAEVSPTPAAEQPAELPAVPKARAKRTTRKKVPIEPLSDAVPPDAGSQTDA